MRAMMRSRYARQGLTDWLTGLGLFAVLAFGLAGDPRTWSASSAAASDTAAANALDIALGAGPQAENALVAALLQTPALGNDLSPGSAMLILGLTFSLMFAFNLAIWRHLRRVYASPRRDGWRRGR